MPDAAASALSPIATRMPLMVSTAVHRLCRSAKIKLAPDKTRIPFGSSIWVLDSTSYPLVNQPSLSIHPAANPTDRLLRTHHKRVAHQNFMANMDTFFVTFPAERHS